MQLCSNCKAIIPVGKRVCEKCGTVIGAVSVAQDYSIAQQTALAKKGDVKAMIQLGNYYRGFKNNKPVDGELPEITAQKWYEKAALAGNATGMKFILEVRSNAVKTKEQEGGPDSKELIKMKRDLYRWYTRAEKLYNENAPGSQRFDPNKLHDEIEWARYSLAYSLSLSDEDEEAYSLVFGKDDTPSCILEALIANQRILDKIRSSKDPGQSELNKLIETNSRLASYLDDLDYAYKPKTMGEEFIYASAARRASLNYSLFFSSPDIGFGILNSASRTVKAKRPRSLIEECLSRYFFDAAGAVHFRE